MKRISLPAHSSQSLELSQIVYGMWRLADDTDTSARRVQEKIEACLEQGITSFDQADIYGGYRCEKLLGAALSDAPHLRDQMEIITKCGIVLAGENFPGSKVKFYDTGAEHISASIDQSLSNMNIEQIDCLLIHRPDPFMDHAETGATLDAAVQSGKIRSIGVSNFKPHDWNLLQSAMCAPLVTNQIEISVLANEPFANGDIAFHQQHGVHPMAWSPLGGGALFDEGNSTLGELRKCLAHVAKEQDVEIDSVAIAWLLRHPCGILPVMGTNNLDRISRLSEATRVEIDKETWFEIYVAAMGHDVP